MGGFVFRVELIKMICKQDLSTSVEITTKKIINSKSKTFLVFCFCFIFGAGLFSAFDWNSTLLYKFFILLFIIGLFVVFFWSKKIIRFILFCFLFFIFGAIRFLMIVPDIDDDLNIISKVGSHIEISAIILTEPDRRAKQTQYILGDIFLCDSKKCFDDKKLKGRILVKRPLYPEYKYGDRLRLSCLIKSPYRFEDSRFRYDKYLAVKNVQVICERSKIIEKVNNKLGGNFLLRNILFFKSIISSRVSLLWSEPNSSLMAGLLYGERAGFSEELKENFNKAGLTHIIAISGYNISIIAAIFMIVLVAFGLYRRQAFWATLVGIFLFVIFTGASASVVRAGIMGVIVLLGQYLGRSGRAGSALMATAGVMILFNPYILLWDAGFQLSFLATVGLLYLSPVFKSWFGVFLKNETVMLWIEPVYTTMSATFITLPLILYQFGRLSLFAVPVNLVVLWIIPWLMLFGFLSVVISFLFFSLGQVVAWGTGFGLQYIIIISEFVGRLSWSSMDLEINIWWMISLYILILIFIIKMYKK